MREGARADSPIGELLRMVAPGTLLREGMENVLRAKTGGLIVLGYDEEVMRLVDGGFFINVDLTASYLYELAKMDGAIILSDDGQRILYANTQLIPDPSIPSTETGMRHRTAERMAKQTGKLVIAISQRRNIITLYQGQLHYSLKDIGVILTKANQALQTLEKYKTVLDQTLTNLSALEFEEMVTLQEVVLVVQRIEMVLRIQREILGYINELGVEGRLISMQMNELMAHFEDEAVWLLKDYIRDLAAIEKESLWEYLHRHDAVMDPAVIARLLGFSGANALEESLSPRGFRILHKIPRLPASIIQNLIHQFGHLNRVLMATIEELDEVDGIGEVRARAIKEGLKRIQSQVFLERHM